MTDYAVQVRYPFHIEITEEDMNIAVQAATKVQAFVLGKFL